MRDAHPRIFHLLFYGQRLGFGLELGLLDWEFEFRLRFGSKLTKT